MPRDKSYRLLECGHDRTELRSIHYRCTAEGCVDRHFIHICAMCYEEGKATLPRMSQILSKRKVYYR